MLFEPKILQEHESSFDIPRNTCVVAHTCMNKDVIKEFWHNFSFQTSNMTVYEESGEFIFCIGNVKKPSLDGNAYSINVTDSGVCVFAESEQALLSGFMTLVDRFYAVDVDEGIAARIDCCDIKDTPTINNRMVHFCIFPETELWELQRFVRFCGALKYTHIVLEFWGMLKYDCMKELAWNFGFTKEQIRPIVREANDLGLEVIPMFNHWGHASAGRVMHGKHVILDQNPSLQTYFSEDGWCWDISKDKVRALLRSVRAELIDLCGDGSYFHIGCDEAYNFDFSEENMNDLCEFINEISEEMEALGRRIFIWGDMFLYRYENYDPNNKYTCNAPSPEIQKYFLSRLSKKIIIADWQYHAMRYPIETCFSFLETDFDCMLCPWDESNFNISATLETVKDRGLMGFMHTTWHTLTSGMPYVTMIALGGFNGSPIISKTTARTYTATILRKVMPAGGDYERAGWSKQQIDFKW